MQELTLAPDEIAEAEQLWIIQSQSKLIQDKQFDVWKKQFGLFLDETGIWRCGWRLGNADIPYGTKHPIILTKQHFLTTLIVRNAHERVMHNGVKDTLTEIRSKFWIIRGRNFVKSIIHSCVLCQRFESKSYQKPQPPPLPTFRVSEDPPFLSHILASILLDHCMSRREALPQVRKFGFVSTPVVLPEPYIWISYLICPLKPSSTALRDSVLGEVSPANLSLTMAKRLRPQQR